MKHKVKIDWLVRHIFRHKWLFAIGLISLVLAAGVNLLIPAVIRHYMNSKELDFIMSFGGILRLAGIIVGLFTLQGILFYFRGYSFHALGHIVGVAIRKDIYRSLIRRDIPFFEKLSPSELVSRLANDAQLVQSAISVNLSVFLRYALQVIGGTALMAMISLPLTVMVALMIPLIVGVSMILGRRLKEITRKHQQVLADGTVIAEESFKNIDTLSTYSALDWSINRFSTVMDSLKEFGLKRARLSAFFTSFASWLLNCILVAIVAFGMVQVINTSMTYGDLMGFLLYGVIVAMSFGFLANTYAEYVQAMGAYERLMEFASGSSISKKENCRKDIKLDAYDVACQSLSFTYSKGSADSYVLKDINCSFKQHNLTAIVGPSGAGKSTLIKLLLKFYEPTNGRILLGSTDLREIPNDLFYSFVGYVPQDAAVFSATLKENISFAKPDATEEEILKALHLANLDDLISNLPNGIHTKIGANSDIRLSGGEKQRLALARLFLREAKVVILDEATSALDSDSESKIREALQKLTATSTVIVIAHRLSTIVNADYIYVLNNGTIYEEGTDRELREKRGLYYALLAKQDISGTI